VIRSLTPRISGAARSTGGMIRNWLRGLRCMRLLDAVWRPTNLQVSNLSFLLCAPTYENLFLPYREMRIQHLATQAAIAYDVNLIGV
jgi:hypothetical protein